MKKWMNEVKSACVSCEYLLLTFSYWSLFSSAFLGYRLHSLNNCSKPCEIRAEETRLSFLLLGSDLDLAF